MRYQLIRIPLLILAALPFAVLYPLASILRIFLQYVVAYRKDVVLSNIRSAFPDFSEAEVRRTATGFYRNLSDVIVESLKMIRMTDKEVAAKTRHINFELCRKHAAAGHHMIFVVSHYSNWEYGATTGHLLRQYGVRPYTIYKKVKAPAINRLMMESRKRFGFELLEMSEVDRFYRNLKPDDPPTAVIFIADQSPDPKRAVWTKFMDQDTAVFYGPELLARRYNIPVLFGSITRYSRGRYNIEMNELCAVPATTSKGEITALHTKALEAMIRKNPADWLWSHRRWKHSQKKAEIKPAH